MGMGQGIVNKVKKARKVRSDKKRDVKPTLSLFVKEDLYYYAYLTNQPVKDAALFLIANALRNEGILLELQPVMISDFIIENRIIKGNHTGQPTKIRYKGETGKATVKFPQPVFEELRNLAFAIGITPTATAAVLIRKGLYNYEFMEEQIRHYARRLDPKRFNEFVKFMKDIAK